MKIYFSSNLKVFLCRRSVDAVLCGFSGIPGDFMVLKVPKGCYVKYVDLVSEEQL